jgi:hypothetical protein
LIVTLLVASCAVELFQFTERQKKKARTDDFDIPPPPPTVGVVKRITDLRTNHTHNSGERDVSDLTESK